MADQLVSAGAEASVTLTVAPAFYGITQASGEFQLKTSYDGFRAEAFASGTFSADSGDLANGRYRR